MERLGGDTELLTEVIDLFLIDCPKRLTDIKAAIDDGHAERLRTTAHALKGAAGTIAAAAVFEASQVLERLGAEGRLDTAAAGFRQLSQDAATLMDTLRGLRTGSADSEAETPCAR
jgi:HPt (histidine-containing phosphotransfer) domain-containing protein